METLLKLYEIKVDHKTNQEIREKNTHTHILNKITADYKY
jgi:hypothetical protein